MNDPSICRLGRDVGSGDLAMRSMVRSLVGLGRAGDLPVVGARRADARGA